MSTKAIKSVSTEWSTSKEKTWDAILSSRSPNPGIFSKAFYHRIKEFRKAFSMRDGH